MKRIKKRIFINRKKISDSVGKANENIIERDLKDFKNRGIIKDYKFLDQNGIDFQITMLDDFKVPLQVKNSIYFQRRHRRTYPKIPSIANPRAVKRRQARLKHLFKMHRKGVHLHLNKNWVSKK